MTEVPKFLYHYTSIDKLALILKNRTIRLNPLDKMDDLQEAKTKDLRNAGQYIFVSCWTDSKDENIPMWNMYTKIDEGVRIGLPANPFEKHVITRATIEEHTHLPQPQLNESIETFFDAEYVLKNMKLIPPLMGEDVLIPVTYTRDKSLLEPEVKIQNGYMYGVIFEKLGRYKSIDWAFQNEWRYRLEFQPSTIESTPEESGYEAQHQFQKMMGGERTMLQDHFDLVISELALSQMEIIPSPKMSNGYKILLQALKEKYNPNATIIESKFEGLI